MQDKVLPTTKQLLKMISRKNIRIINQIVPTVNTKPPRH